MDIDPRIPVVVGVGQVSERIDEADYQARSPVELAAAAARAALNDAGADGLAQAVDTVGGIRQFEISIPGAAAPLGRADNFPRAVCRRIGADPTRAILDVVGGQGPQRLVTELAGSIADGDADVVLAFGAEAISTVRHLARSEKHPDWSEQIGGQLDDRGYGLKGLLTRELQLHRLVDAPSLYALLEHARRGTRKQTREEYARDMGELFAPFTQVAARNPHAAAPTARTADELITATERNRPIADPYPRLLVSRDQVNQGAAVLLLSVAAAERLAVPRDRWVFLHGHADLRERDLLDRQDLGAYPAAAMAVEHALEQAGIDLDDLTTIDVYSCFPIAVSAVCDGLGLDPQDPRGLTVTGGLPYFGGAGNNYSMHAIAETVVRMRAQPGAYGLVGANGGTLSKYSVGVYSTSPAPWRPDTGSTLQAQIEALPTPDRTAEPNGWATIETYTVKHSRHGATGFVIGRLEADGSRFLATSQDSDDQMLSLLTDTDPLGVRVFVRSFGFGNRVAVSEERMAELFPPRSLVLRDDYEHVRVRRDRHLLEVTIDRPEARNALHPPANEELDEIFDAFFADDDLWVAILTGAGDRAFSAGNDMAWSASGRPTYVPKSGFAGLTNRRAMPKPVIAAVNGYAMGGGLETALACHVVVADQAAQFALSEVKVGLIAGAGGLIRLPRTIPPKVATEMILTGRRASAEEMARYGLVSRITEVGRALDGARQLAAEIMQGSPTSVRLSLQVMADTRAEPDPIIALGLSGDAVEALFVSEDMYEGMTAFAQKRPPVWRNR